MVGNISKEECTGCKMCEDICPKAAISFETDEQGFWYPKVDTGKCIECGLCDQKCPSLNGCQFEKMSMPAVYSVWSKDENVRITSTSGGAFWEIATAFINNGGTVAGCTYTDDWKAARHMIAHTSEDLLKIKGSKYFQSDTEGIYKAVKEELEKGKKVLFCGTPCQNAAIKNYLGKAYDNLFCLDFICRSINSPLAFKEYISELEQQYGSKVVEVHLKNKDFGWQSLASKVKFENGEETVRDKNVDWWVKGFIYNDLYTRESCYQCKYKVLPRIAADITIGDFWGIQNQEEEDMFKGISVLMINSKKGRELFEICKDKFEFQEHTLKEVMPGNPALLNNPIKTAKQEKFFKLLKKKKFSKAVKLCVKQNIFNKTINVAKKVCQKIWHIIKFIKNSKISVRKFVYYNYFCKNIVRLDKSKIIPYKGIVLDLHPTSRIYLKGQNLLLCTNKLKGSNAETHIRMNENAVWNCNNGGYLFYNTVLEIKPNAVLDSGYFSANGGSVIIAHKHIVFGEDVMIGRNVIIYDSDFHSILDETGIAYNYPKPVIIEDHVWLTTNVMVQKGVRIGRDSLITAYTVVNKDVPEHSIVGGKSIGKVISNEVKWDREMCPM